MFKFQMNDALCCWIRYTVNAIFKVLSFIWCIIDVYLMKPRVNIIRNLWRFRAYVQSLTQPNCEIQLY